MTMYQFIIIMIVFLTAQPIFAEENIIDKIQLLEPSIVTVQTELVKIITMPNSQNRKTATYTRTACGVIIDPSGIIVTNTHTIINAPVVYVILPTGEKIQAEVMFASLGYDFSLLKINTKTPLTALSLADSNAAQVNEPIIAVGSTEFNKSTLLSGTIVNLVTSQSTGNVEFIDINVNLYHGDSGGPVFDRNGRLLGIVMAKHKSLQNIAVIIASNKIRDEYWHYK